jgi:hypothetical protein
MVARALRAKASVGKSAKRSLTAPFSLGSAETVILRFKVEGSFSAAPDGPPDH